MVDRSTCCFFHMVKFMVEFDSILEKDCFLAKLIFSMGVDTFALHNACDVPWGLPTALHADCTVL